jgi:hypothetical protein
MAEVVVEITEDGQIRGDVQGVLGSDCEGLLDFLKDLGAVDDEGKTRDYYRKPRRRGRSRRNQEDQRRTRR